MKKVLTTAVFAVALAMVANAYDKTVSTFEDGALSNYFASLEGATITNAVYTSYNGLLPSETSSAKCLDVSTDTALERQANGGSAVSVAGNFYIDMMAKFNETESAVINNDDKLALYMNVDGNLVVVAGSGKTVCETTKHLDPGTWYRVAIHMIGNIYSSGDPRPGFVVSINGEDVAAKSDSYVELTGLTPTADAYYTDRKLFPSILAAQTITSLAITGVGSVDDIVFADTKSNDSSVVNPWADDPEPVPAASVEYHVVDASGTTVDGGSVKDIDYASLNTGTYSVQASASAYGKEAVKVGDTIGVMKYTDMEEGKQKLISVPWKSVDGQNVRVADMFAGAQENDRVDFYVNGSYKGFTFVSGVWTPDDVESGYTSESTFAPGTAAFYTPATDHTVTLVGISQATTEVAPTAGSGEKVWTALGSTVATNTPIASIMKSVPESARATGTSGLTAKDKLAVQNSDGTYKFYFIDKDGNVKVFPKGSTPTGDDVVPAGGGLMYLSTGSATPTIKFGN